MVKPMPDCPSPSVLSLVQKCGRITFRESVLIDNEVFFLLDDEPHLLFLEAGCPSIGVLGSDDPSNVTVQTRQCYFNTTDSSDT